jgi:hypothetical protein
MSKRFNLRKFVRKHNQLFTYVGALIVFLTFVVKEGLKDSWEHRAESIETAEYIKTVLETEQDSQRDIQAALRGLNEQAKVLRTLHLQMQALQRHAQGLEELPPGFKDKNSCYAGSKFECIGEVLRDERLKGNQSYLRDLWQEAAMAAGDLRVRYEDLGILADKLPEGTEGRNGWKLANEEVVKLVDDYYGDQRIYDDLSGQKFETIRNALEKLIDRSAALAMQVETMTFKLWESSKTELDENRKRSQYARWVSSCLYAVGWGLGLLGKVYGVAEANGAE